MARLTVTAEGLQSAHKCIMSWRPCDAMLDAVIGPCPVHSSGRVMGEVSADQVCGAFIVSDPLSVEPVTGFDFAFGRMIHGKTYMEQDNRVRVEVDVSEQSTVIYEGVGDVVKHSSMGTSSDQILCDRGLCLRSSSSRRYFSGQVA